MHVTDDIELIYKYVDDQELINRFLTKEYGISGGELVVTRNFEVKCIVFDGVDVKAITYIPLEVVMKHSDIFNVFTVKKGEADYIYFSISMKFIDEKLKKFIEG